MTDSSVGSPPEPGRELPAEPTWEIPRETTHGPAAETADHASGEHTRELRAEPTREFAAGPVAEPSGWAAPWSAHPPQAAPQPGPRLAQSWPPLPPPTPVPPSSAPSPTRQPTPRPSVAAPPPVGAAYGPPYGYAPAAGSPPGGPPGATLGPAGLTPSGPASFPPPGAPPPQGRRTGPALAAAAVVGLLAGLLGGGLGATWVNGTRATTPSSTALPAPAPGVTVRPDGSIAKIAATALPSVVTVKIAGAGGSGNGSGFVIDGQGHVLTNNHVVSAVAASGRIEVELSDGSTLPATIVGRDASYDLAVLKVERTDLVPLTWGTSADVVVGDGVIAVGAPLGLESTVTSGIVSALNRPVAAGGGDETSFINAIQTDAAINPGNSGGPLLDMAGRVIGVNSAIARDPGSSGDVSGSIGVGFAIPSDQAAKTAAQLIATGKAEHPVIGVRLDRSFQGEGARIIDPGGVASGSPAAAAGLRDGDVVVAFEGRKVVGPNQLIVAIRARAVGDTVRLTVDRGGEQVQLTLTLQASS